MLRNLIANKCPGVSEFPKDLKDPGQCSHQDFSQIGTGYVQCGRASPDMPEFREISRIPKQYTYQRGRT